MLNVIFFLSGLQWERSPTFPGATGDIFPTETQSANHVSHKKGLIIGLPDVWHFERLEKKLKENIYVH